MVTTTITRHFTTRSLAHFGDHFAPQFNIVALSLGHVLILVNLVLLHVTGWCPTLLFAALFPKFESDLLSQTSTTQISNNCNFPFHTAETSARESAVLRHSATSEIYSVLTYRVDTDPSCRSYSSGTHRRHHLYVASSLIATNSGLAWHTDDQTLRAKFEEFGQVDEAVSRHTRQERHCT